MNLFYIGTGLALIISFLADRNKTVSAVKIAVKKFLKILPEFLIMLVLVSITLTILPEEVISDYLGGENRITGMFTALTLGSVTVMPGFIAFPMCGILLEKGVTYMVLSAFSTSLMLVGVLSFPVEGNYFGTRAALLRNIISFCIAIVVALATGLIYGEIK